MLGVVLYLTPVAFRGTLDFIARLPEGSGVIFDYNGPRHVLAPHEVAARDRLAAQVQELGEPFRLFFSAGGDGDRVDGVFACWKTLERAN